MAEKVEYHTFTVGGTDIMGFTVDDDGAMHDFTGHLQRHYSQLKRATAAARRKYQDSSIQVVEMKQARERYRVPMDKLMEIAEKID